MTTFHCLNLTKSLFKTVKRLKSNERKAFKSFQLKFQNSQKEEEVLFRGSNFEFPCLNKRFVEGPEPTYNQPLNGYEIFTHDKPFKMYYNNGILPKVDLAYETWGELNEDKSNAVLMFTGLSASSHAKSHQKNTSAGWWEKFIGGGRALDTNEFFVICVNQLGGCYGST